MTWQCTLCIVLFLITLLACVVTMSYDSCISDGARCLEVGGVHENPDLPEAFHKRRMHEFANLD